MKKKIYAALAFALYATTFHAQQIYELSAPVKEKTIYTGHLKMGGSNPSGGNISVNSYYMSIDGKPVIPVMGEFHFTRYPRAQWEQEIVKMKAGGVNDVPLALNVGLVCHESGHGDLPPIYIMCALLFHAPLLQSGQRKRAQRAGLFIPHRRADVNSKLIYDINTWSYLSFSLFYSCFLLTQFLF